MFLKKAFSLLSSNLLYQYLFSNLSLSMHIEWIHRYKYCFRKFEFHLLIFYFLFQDISKPHLYLFHRYAIALSDISLTFGICECLLCIFILVVVYYLIILLGFYLKKISLLIWSNFISISFILFYFISDLLIFLKWLDYFCPIFSDSFADSPNAIFSYWQQFLVLLYNFSFNLHYILYPLRYFLSLLFCFLFSISPFFFLF